jgi:hypothetical protein
MLDPSLGPEWKPDKARFVVYPHRSSPNLQVAVDPSFPNAWTKPPYYARLKSWAQEQAKHGAFVFVRIRERVIVLLPDRDCDIGEVGLDDDILVARDFTPAGYTYRVEVKRRPAAAQPLPTSPKAQSQGA